MIYRFAEFLFKIPGAFLAEVEKLTLKLKMDLPGPPVILKKKKGGGAGALILPDSQTYCTIIILKAV